GVRLPGRGVVLADPRFAEAELVGPAELLEIPLMPVVQAALGRVRWHREQSVVHVSLLGAIPPTYPTLPRTSTDARPLARSRAPFARPVVRVAALLARTRVVHGRGHRDGQAQRQPIAHVTDVMDGPSRHPHDVLFDRFQRRTTGQLPLEHAVEDHPPLVEV